MNTATRRKQLVDLEAEYRRTETALAVAQAEHEKAYAAIWAFMGEANLGPPHVLAFSPEITMH